MYRQPTCLNRSKDFGRNIFCLSVLLLVCLFPSSGYSQTVTTLELARPVEDELTGGQKNLYKFTLSANQYAKVVVEQRGIDVSMRLESGAGRAIETDYDPRLTGTETFELTTKTADNFTITVRAKQKNAVKGLYQIKIEEIRPANEKDYALDEARQLNWEATRLWFEDKYDEALPLAKRSVEIREKELGREHSDVGTSLNTLANQYYEKGDYGAAEPLYLRALGIKEKLFGKDYVVLGSILNSLGNLYVDTGEYVKAESVYERALKIREKNLGPDHLLIASVLLNLGVVSRVKGDLVKTATYYTRVLEIREKALGPDHPEVAAILNNLGNLYSDLDPDISKPESLYLRALQIREKNFGPDNPQVAQTLSNLAILYAHAGDFTKALPFGQRALTIFEKSLGAEHPIIGSSLTLLATIYKNTGDYAQAESLYQRAASIGRKTQSEYHPLLGGTYSNLAALHALKGEIEKALAEQKRANAIVEFNTELNLTTGSERQKLEYMKTIREYEDRTLTLGFQFAPQSKEAAEMSATIILQRKGRVLDAVSDNLNALRRRFNSQDQSLLDDFNKVTGEIAELISGAAENSLSEADQAKIKALADRREKLEAEISLRANGFYERSKPVVLADVQSAIPADGALLEFTAYQPASMSSVSGYDGAAPHYAVFILRSNEFKWKDLGEAGEINAGIDALRQALRDPKRKDVQQLARAVDEKIMQPVRALLGDAKQLLVSPDGELNLIPFEALVDEKGRYSIENYSVTYLTSGRDLLRMRVVRESKGNPLVIANPSFGPPVADQIEKLNSTGKQTTRGRNQWRSITATRDLSEVYFAPLGGTAEEARSIKTLFPEAVFLTGAEATESALKQTIAPRILHIATHGFFLQDAETSSSKTAATRNIETRAKIENPLLRSGLALAGANQRNGGAGNDGILTALEASGLNLWGTKLVVLSACDTGLGEVRNGEGVYGLRRAFVLAGAESLVMSLWAVSDSITRELMTGYYKNLKQGAGRGAALRRIQLEMLKKEGRQHPFYWASFIQSGDWANLAR